MYSQRLSDHGIYPQSGIIVLLFSLLFIERERNAMKSYLKFFLKKRKNKRRHLSKRK